MLPAIAARIAEADLSNVRTPLRLDVRRRSGPRQAPAERFDAIYRQHAAHRAVERLRRLDGRCGAAARIGRAAGHHGPLLRDRPTRGTGQLAFDESPRRAIRRGASGTSMTSQRRQNVDGLALQQRHAMPANNLLTAFRRGCQLEVILPSPSGEGARARRWQSSSIALSAAVLTPSQRESGSKSAL